MTNCFSGSQSGDGISQLSHLTVPAPGDYIVRIWLADGAGNVSSARTPAMHLKFDDLAPSQAQPQHRNGWLSKSDATSY